MRNLRHISLALLALVAMMAVAVTPALADTVSGTVTDGTNGKPASGATVTLLDPLGGMAEIATTKSNAKGEFSFDAPPARGPRLVRAERGGVNYFKMLTPGTQSVDVNVYDAASKVEGIKGTADVIKAQTDGGTLQILEMFVLTNDSQPPRTLAAPNTFEFALPDGAQVDDTHAQAPNGQPISVQTKPVGQKNHFAFSFALKPGETRLQVSYHLPYGGQASFTPSLTREFDHFVVVLPSAMRFAAKDANAYQSMGNQPGANVQVSMQAKVGQDLSYSLSGNGVFPDENEQQSASAAPPSANGRDDGQPSGPGGGLGKPIDAPDGLAKYRWYILGALLTVLIGGGIWTHERTAMEEARNFQPAAPAASAAPPLPPSAAYAPPLPVANAAPAQPPAPSNLLLSALKEEMFALEVERQQGKLSQEEYDKARVALEQTLHRALARTQG